MTKSCGSYLEASVADKVKAGIPAACRAARCARGPGRKPELGQAPDVVVAVGVVSRQPCAGFSDRDPVAVEEPRIHGGCSALAGAGDRRKHGNLHTDQPGAAAESAGARSAAACGFWRFCFRRYCGRNRTGRVRRIFSVGLCQAARGAITGPFQGIASYGSFSNKVSVRLGAGGTSDVRRQSWRRPLWFRVTTSTFWAHGRLWVERSSPRMMALRERERSWC